MQKTETYTNVWNFLKGAGMTDAGAAGLMGNLYAESGIIPNRVEVLCIQRLREHGRVYTDNTYTAAVDSGKISRAEFLHPLPGKQYGYGIAQWTSPDRKGNLYDYCMGVGKSIGDLKSQLGFLVSELAIQYPQVLHVLQSAFSVGEASDAVLYQFEQPADAGKQAQNRTDFGMAFYDLYSQKEDSKMTKTEAAIQWMEKTAQDNSHGYDQTNRWGPDYDCSSAVITAWENAGVPVKTNGATYTGNMLGVFLKCGFRDITSQVNLSTGAGLKRGDVLLNTSHHTAMYCGNGQEVEASINEKGTATGGKPGDQTGREFLIRSYRNYPWNCVLRYEGGSMEAPAPAQSQKSGLNKTPKRVGKVGNMRPGSQLAVRTWAGTDFDHIKSYPWLNAGDMVDICDSVKAADGAIWYYIRIAGKYYGFSSSKYIN